MGNWCIVQGPWRIRNVKEWFFPFQGDPFQWKIQIPENNNSTCKGIVRIQDSGSTEWKYDQRRLDASSISKLHVRFIPIVVQYVCLPSEFSKWTISKDGLYLVRKWNLKLLFAKFMDTYEAMPVHSKQRSLRRNLIFWMLELYYILFWKPQTLIFHYYTNIQTNIYSHKLFVCC